MRHHSTLMLVTHCLQSGKTLQVKLPPQRARGGQHMVSTFQTPHRFVCVTQDHDYFARNADEIAAVFIDLVGRTRARDVALRALHAPPDASMVTPADRGAP